MQAALYKTNPVQNQSGDPRRNVRWRLYTPLICCLAYLLFVWAVPGTIWAQSRYRSGYRPPMPTLPWGPFIPIIPKKWAEPSIAATRLRASGKYLQSGPQRGLPLLPMP